MSRQSWPTGLVTALVSPLEGDGINVTGTKELVERQVRAGVSGILVAGGTGEHGALTFDERAELVHIVAETLDGRVPFIVQTGALATRDAVRLTQEAQGMGAAGVLLPAPFGEAVNWREKRAFYEEVDEAASLPIMLYNTRTAGLMTVEQVAELAQLTNVSAIKDSSGDATLFGDLVAWSRAADFAVYTGWDDQLAPAVLGGAHGAVLGAGNVAPELIVQVMDLCYRRQLDDEFDAAWGRLRPFLRFIGQSENYVSIVKLAVQWRGVDVGDVRRPYLMPSERERDALAAVLHNLEGASVS
jgi:4-hydroxy-tetrahydrodipicolinate synthase